MSSARTDRRSRVLIAGSGVAALEATTVLGRHATDLCEIELISPLRDFTVRSAGSDPFGTRGALRLDLESLAARLGVGFRADALRAVDPERREALTRRGERLGYDALVVASGTRWREAVTGATTVWASPDRVLLDALVSGRPRSIVLCAHSGEPWTLPLYELALAVAERLGDASPSEVKIVVVTPESRPGGILTPVASEALGAALDDAGIRVEHRSEPLRFESGRLISSRGTIPADRAVALPRRDGCWIANLPLDDEGFISCDGFGRVSGAEGVHAVGEVTSFPVRHSAVAAEQARAAAEAIAADAGAPVTPRPARAVISGRLLAEPAAPHRNGSGTGSRNGGGALWWPPEALAGPGLRAHLTERLGLELPLPAGGMPVELDLDRSRANGQAAPVAAAE
jgi:sulfide:quinone oxidoreductase